MVDRGGDQGAVAAPLQPGAQVILAHVVGADIAAQQRGLMDVVDRRSAGQSANLGRQ